MDVGYYGSDRNQRMLRERVQKRWMDAYAPVRHLDPILVIATLLLTAIGVVMVYSATVPRLELSGLPTSYYATRQLVNTGVAVVGLVVAAVVDYRYARTYSAFIYGASILLLVVVLTPVGSLVQGCQCWINLGFTQVQPSELAKVAVVVVVAAVLHERKGEPGLLAIFAAIVLVALPAGLVLLQPDPGTFLVFPVVAGMLLLVGGTKVRYLLGLAVAAVAGSVIALTTGLIALEAHHMERITSFLNPAAADPQSSFYNAQQSMIAIGSGGVAGKGLFEGTQTNLSYVPENHTDFIFTVIGEEFGFIGAVVVLALFAIIIWRGLRIAAMAKDLFGTLLATGAVAIFAFQMFINIGMTIGIAPVIGIPLPFVSYGGTSLLAAYVLVGFMLNVHMRRF